MTLRRLVLSLVLVAGAAAPAPTALAASTTGQYAIKGVGTATCQQYSDEQAKKSHRFFQFVGWVNGYLSGYNRLAEQTADIVPWQSTELLAAFIASYCRKNPEARLAEATNQLIAVLAPSRLQDSSERVKAEAGGKAAFIYETILRRAQQVLVDHSYLAIAPDGRFGPETQAAFEQYQRDNKLEVTGLPDQRTLLSIFR